MPDAWQHDPIRVTDEACIRSEKGVSAHSFECLLGRAQVADAVVEHGDQRSAWSRLA